MGTSSGGGTVRYVVEEKRKYGVKGGRVVAEEEVAWASKTMPKSM